METVCIRAAPLSVVANSSSSWPYPVGYFWAVIEVRQTPQYQRWFDGLRDREARFRIAARIRRLSLGYLGDVRSVGGSVFELRIGSGPGYRVYYHRERADSIVLLGGGDKSSQRRDIRRANELVRGL